MNSSKFVFIILILIIAVGVVVWYMRAPESQPATMTAPPAKPIGVAVEIKVPLGLPPVPVPADNPPTAETIALGRRLYYDAALSADNTISCASCHHPDKGFADDKPFSEGVRAQKGGRNSPTVLNSAYLREQFWDGRASSLEEQAEGPVGNPVEMGHTLAGVEQKLMADPNYRAEFKKAFGSDKITYEMAEKAIASFERTVLCGDSPFDRFQFGGDNKALSAAAQRGLKLFLDPKKGNCNACHKIGEKDALFTDNKYHNIGVGADTRGNFADVGRFQVTKIESDRGAFRTPTLRNIAKTAPYMHDGSLRTLKDVMDFYVGGGNSNPHLDKEIHALDFLTGRERIDLVAFMESLTCEAPPNVGPPAGSLAGPPKK